MRIDIVTIFPEMFEGVINNSILGRARREGLVEINLIDFRAYSNNKHNTVDDTPYGGGGGMVLKPEPIFSAVEELTGSVRAGTVEVEGGEAPATARPRVILTCPQGEVFSQAKALDFASEEHLVIIAGHYEGYDERIRQYLVTDEISIGDYVLTGGEIPAMVIVDSVTRLLPGVLGNDTSAVLDSFREGLLEYPHYTRPAEFRGWKVPDVLLSGHHGNVERWRRKESFRRTLVRRPDLLQGRELSKEDRKLLDEVMREENQTN
ncbi:tRNA (guanosine(37)-N1)-methyltransferase TrmD [Tumebacillus flagellatus]|uniref:tRNA (guanine-N(1)-)-methyltransferase n=1 Tax=Tumebacillus flagellatus TaxID=1157490 RepID=A0A074LPY0_9BACL|nr:tRNA (guanosine(37)-N1)-methyltransferase TrmD [Tumebacillus flagellatus]KEO81913.1 tRNA (guanine-N1)-methyltransferase [Tumebacillus flagellatus]